MPKRTRPHREALLELLRDRREAAAYLNAAEESGEMFLVALRNVAEAFQMSKVAAAAGVSRESLYRMLSDTGNPTHASLRGIAKAIGLRPRWEVDTPSAPSERIDLSDRDSDETATTGVDPQPSTTLATDRKVVSIHDGQTPPIQLKKPVSRAVEWFSYAQGGTGR